MNIYAHKGAKANRLGLLIASLVTICTSLGCTSNYTKELLRDQAEAARLMAKHELVRRSRWVIHPHTPIYLTRPLELSEHSRPRHFGALFQALQQQLPMQFANFTAATQQMSVPLALSQAQIAGGELMLVPVLMESESRRNSRAGLLRKDPVEIERPFGSDRASFQIRVYEVNTGRLIDIANVYSRGPILSRHETLPQELFRSAAREYTMALVGR